MSVVSVAAFLGRYVCRTILEMVAASGVGLVQGVRQNRHARTDASTRGKAGRPQRNGQMRRSLSDGSKAYNVGVASNSHREESRLIEIAIQRRSVQGERVHDKTCVVHHRGFKTWQGKHIHRVVQRSRNDLDHGINQRAVLDHRTRRSSYFWGVCDLPLASLPSLRSFWPGISPVFLPVSRFGWFGWFGF